MKKFLSILLALSLIISVIPAAFAETTGEPLVMPYDLYNTAGTGNISFKTTDEDTVGFTIARDFGGTTYYLRDEFWGSYGDRGWKLFDASDDMMAVTRFRLSNSYMEIGRSGSTEGYQKPLDITLSLEAPKKSGFFIPSMKGGSAGTAAQRITWYLAAFPSEDSIPDSYKETLDTFFSADTTTPNTYEATKVLYSQPGDVILSRMMTGNSYFYNFYNITLTEVLNPNLKITVDDVELNTIDNTTALITSTTVTGDNKETAMDVAGGFVTYCIEDVEGTNIATINPETGEITAVSAGTAEVWAQSPDGAVKSNPITVTVTAPAAEPEEDEELTNAFDDAVKADAPSDYIAPTVSSIDATGIVGTPVLQADGSYKITAPETVAGKGNFLYWKKAMTTNEKIVSLVREFNYVPESEGRNILVAVYEGDINLDAPKCYNANGQYIPDAQPIDADLPSMAGYGKAYKWEQYEDTNVWVAQYEAETPIADIDVTVTGDNTSGGGTNLAYGAEVICKATGENFKCWKKTYGDGTAKIVSTDAEYTFNAWEDCTVTAIYEEHTYTGSKMKIIIDSFTAGEETGVMAEFLGFGNNVIEKGIMFENNRIAMTTVGNQFSVIADEEGTYKGYVIVEDTDGLKLITDGSYTK